MGSGTTPAKGPTFLSAATWNGPALVGSAVGHSLPTQLLCMVLPVPPLPLVPPTPPALVCVPPLPPALVVCPPLPAAPPLPVPVVAPPVDAVPDADVSPV